MNKNASIFLGVLAFFVIAGVAQATEYRWNPSVLSSFWNDPFSWSVNQCPADGDLAKFDDNLTEGANYVVKIADADQTDGVATWISGLKDGTKVTLDATGMTWTKIRTADEWADTDAKGLSGKILRFDNSDHIFNIESVDKNKANDEYGFMLTDGRISYQAAAEGDQLTFESGVFNNYQVDGVEPPHSTILMHSTYRKNSRVVFAAGSEAHLRNAEIRGLTPGGEVVVDGGDVHFYRGLGINTKSKEYNNEEEGVLRVSAGTATVEPGHALWIGKSVRGAGRLIVEGTGVFDNKGSVVYFPDVVESVGYLDVKGAGVYRSESADLYAGHQTDSKAYITVSEQGRLEMPNRTLKLAEDKDRSFGSLVVKGEGYVGFRNLTGAGGGTGRQSEIALEESGALALFSGMDLAGGTDAQASFTMKDDSRLTLDSNTADAHGLNLAGGANARADFTMADNSCLTLNADWTMAFAEGAGAQTSLTLTNNAQLVLNTHKLNLGNNKSAAARIQFLGGTIVGGFRQTGVDKDGKPEYENSCMNFRGGPGTEVVFDGVDATVVNMIIEGAQKNPAYTNTVVLKSGSLKVRTEGVGDGLDIRGNDRNAMFLLAGGELTVGKGGGGMVRLGHSGANNGYHAIFRQTGGVADIGAVFNICDSAGSDGEIELLGGTMRIWTMRGWNGCETRGGTGKATLYADGGTLEPWKDGLNFMYTMSGATVGAKGLTVDTKDYNNLTMSVKIDNAEGADGLFVKKGTGMLKFVLKESEEKNGGNAVAFAGRNLNGTHAFTRVDEGTLLLLDQEEAEFGKNVTVKGGATLSLEGTVATLTVDTLTLGDGNGFAVLKLDAGDTVVVNGENGVVATCGAIDLPWGAENGTYPVFVCRNGATVAANELNKLAVYNASADKDYRWVASTADDVTTWSMVISNRGTGSSSVTYENGSVSTNGEGSVSSIAATTGTSVEAGDIALARLTEVDVASGASLTLNGPIFGTGTEFRKTGSGKLTLSGANSEFFGSFVSQGGLLEVLTRAALGSDPLCFPLVLGNGTFKYDGEPATFAAPLRLAGDEAGKSVIIENNGDMTFQGVEHVRGTFVKKGVGALTLELGAGSYMLGHDSVDGDYGKNKGSPVFPESGDAPTEKTGLYGVTIVEGALKVKGQGLDKSTLSTDNTSLVGTGYPAKAAPALEVVDARVNFGKGSRHGVFAQSYPMSSPAPEIRLTNAWLQVNSLGLGDSMSPSVGKGPHVAMKDSTLFNEYTGTLGTGTTRPVIDADNSRLTSDGMYGWTIAAASFEADFHGTNALFGSVNKKETYDNSGRITSHDHPVGTFLFRDGARLQMTRGILFADSKLQFVFNGGIFEILPHDVEAERQGESTWKNRDRSITTTGEGLEIAICEGSVHTFKVPIAGDGKIVKTGLGTLSFARDEQRDADEKLLQNTGVTEVAEGTLELDGALVAETAQFKVDAGAVLALGGTAMTVASFEAEEGAIVSGAAVTTASLKLTAGVVPTFTATTFGFSQRQGVEIDFGENEPDLTQEPFAVATFVDANGQPMASLDVSFWRGMAKGYTRKTLGKHGGFYRFSYDPKTGVVSATYCPRGGIVLIVR